MSAASYLFYIGTYTRTTSRGIYLAQLDGRTGQLTSPTLAAELTNPTWVTVHLNGRVLYSIEETKSPEGKSGGAVRAYAISPDTHELTSLNAEPTGDSLCHSAVDSTGRVLITTSYGGGQVSSFPLSTDGRLGARKSFIEHTGPLGPNPKRQDKPHAHSVTISPDNRFAFVADLGQDRVYAYSIDLASAALTPAPIPFTAFNPGTGPRHSKFSPDGQRFYVINELDGTITVSNYTAASGALALIQHIPTLPADFHGENTAAEVRVHPNGRWLYASNRGHDSIAIYAISTDTGVLRLIEIMDCGGQGPRNFTLTPDGAWLVCAHQGSDSLVSFQVDAETGRLRRIDGKVTIPQPVCIAFLAAN